MTLSEVTLKKLLTIFRNSLHTIAFAMVLLVGMLYVAVHFNLAGMIVERSLTVELAEKLNTRVTLDGDVEVDWLNQVVLNHLTVYDQQDDTLLYARRALVAYDLLPLLQHHLVLNTCQLIDFDIRVHKDSLQNAYNFQFIVDALAKNDPESVSFIQSLDLNAILLRKGQVCYDDKINISQLNTNLHLHGNNLQAKKLHFITRGTSVKASRFEMEIQPVQVMKEQGPVFSLHGLSLSNDNLSCLAEIQGAGKELDVQLTELMTQGPLPSLPTIHDLKAKADIKAFDILSATDSIRFKATIQEASAKVDKMGRTSITAQIEGMPCDATIQCQFSSESGDASLQGLLNSNFAEKDFRLKGHCLTSGFDLSQLLPSSAEVGTVALDADFDIRQKAAQPLSIAMDGNVSRLDFRNHTYRDILINGIGQGNQMRGNIQLNDSLGCIELDYDLNLAASQPRYKLDGQVRHLQPYALQLTDKTWLDSIAITGNLQADIIAQHWNQAEGIFNLTHLTLQRGDQRLAMEPILFEGTADRGALSSQLLYMEYQRDRHDLSYHIQGRLPVANEVYSLFRLPLSATSMTRFDAVFDQHNQLRDAWLDLPTVVVNGNQEITAMAEVRSSKSDQLFPTIDLSIKNPDHEIKGTLKGEVSLSPFVVTLSPTTFLYNNEELKLAGARLARNEKGDYVFSDFQLQGSGQSVSASGTIGNNGDNDLLVKLDHFGLGQVFSLLDKGYLKFDGQATGNILLTSDPHNHLRTEDLLIENFSYIDTLLGDARLNLDFAIPDRRIDVTCDITADKQFTTHASGSICIGEHDSLDLWFDTNQLPIGFINYWSGSIIQQFSGRLSGAVRLFGHGSALQLAGDPVVDGRFTHNIIGAHFHLHDKIHLEEDLMVFDDVDIDDCHGHPMILNAQVTHHYLKHFGYDVNLEMPDASQGFLVMDREQAPGRIYWGQIYASGRANLKGGDGHHRFNLNVTTTDKSWFYLSPFEQDFASDGGDGYSFLTFRDKARLSSSATEADGSSPIASVNDDPTDSQEEDSKTDIQVDMQVNATDQCQVFVQLDPLADDKLICRGSGDLTVQYDPRRDITLAGTYRISSGTYGMSMKGDLMNKTFQLQNTSTVRFSGVPSEAELSLDARYGIPSVNLTDLDESITTLGSLSRSSVPVDCLLAVTGQLSAPQVSFNLEVKNVSEEIQAYVHNVIGTQEMLNQEVLYLLLFSKFYTPQYAQNTQSRSGSELTSFASASITSQLNQLLGHLSDNFTMGTNFRTDRGDFSDMEMDLSLSTRLLGDRLLLNGNVGYRDPANRVGRGGNSNSFIGDFDLEFLINNSGSIRAKAYSHYNERDYSINNALTTQGIGFILRKDFKTFDDFWRRKK